MAPSPCPPPSPSSCSLSPLNWPLQPCNSPALKPKINRCQQLVFWVVAAVLHPHPTPDSMPLGSWFQAKARPVGVQGGLRRAAGGWPHPFPELELGKTQCVGPGWVTWRAEAVGFLRLLRVLGFRGRWGAQKWDLWKQGVDTAWETPLHNPSGQAPGNLLSCQLLPSLLREVSLVLHAFNT